MKLPYPGEPIQDGEIRLIKLLPGEWSDEIRCRLFHVKLHEQPKFQSLSYVWGSPKITRPISLNGQRYFATVNLESALRHLRYLYGEMVLWVDALAINQIDIEERTSQVKLMGNIYQSCEKVLVYLGDELGRAQGTPSSKKESVAPPPPIHFHDDDNDLAIANDLVRKFAHERQYRRRDYSAADVFAFLRLLSQKQHLSELFHDDAEEEIGLNRTDLFEALRCLMHTPFTPWWSRTWVIQEATLPRELILFYGTVSAPWSIFARAASNYVEHSGSCCSAISQLLPRDQQKVLADFSQRVIDIDQLRFLYMRTPGSRLNELENKSGFIDRQRELLPFLRRFRNRKASDPRDKVYALLSLLHLEQKYTSLLPDYSLGVAEVFQKATLEAIYASKCLTVLSADLGRKFRQDLPTWVPDWDVPGGYTNTTRADSIELYDACNGMKVDESNVYLMREGLLHVEGTLIDSVVYTEEVMWGDSADSSRTTILKWWMAMNSEEWKKRMQAVPLFWTLLCADIICREAGARASTKLRRVVSDDEAMFASWAVRAERSPFRTFEIALNRPSPEESERSWRHGTEDAPLVSDFGAPWANFIRNPLPKKRDKALQALESLLPTYEWMASAEHKILYIHGRPEWREMQGLMTPNSNGSTLLWEEFCDSGLAGRVGNQASALMDDSIMAATSSRRLFLTLSGYIGLAPADTAEGDVLFFLKGGKTPFALRKVPLKGSYQLVGDCYVQGLMDGGIEGFRGTEWETVVLE